MIESHNGVYSVGGTPCKQLIEHAIARGWAKRPKVVIIETVIVKEPKHEPLPIPVPMPTPKGMRVMHSDAM